MGYIRGSEPITNDQDTIDSREIIDRIEYLESIEQNGEMDGDGIEDAEGDIIVLTDEEREELRILREVAEEGEGSPDWKYGEVLISDIYFEDYAKQLAEDIGAIDGTESWPLNHIDWFEAAEALQADYMSIDFDGETYWIRS